MRISQKLDYASRAVVHLAKKHDGQSVTRADDIAESVVWAATLPPHVNVNRLEVMPTVQAFNAFNVERTGT